MSDYIVIALHPEDGIIAVIGTFPFEGAAMEFVTNLEDTVNVHEDVSYEVVRQQFQSPEAYLLKMVELERRALEPHVATKMEGRR